MEQEKIEVTEEVKEIKETKMRDERILKRKMLQAWLL